MKASVSSYSSGTGAESSTGREAFKEAKAASKAASDGVGGGSGLGAAFPAMLVELFEVERDFLVALLHRGIV